MPLFISHVHCLPVKGQLCRVEVAMCLECLYALHEMSLQAVTPVIFFREQLSVCQVQGHEIINHFKISDT